MQFCANLASESRSCSGDFIITESLMGEKGTSHFGEKMAGIPDAPRRAVGAAGGRGLSRLLGCYTAAPSPDEGQEVVPVWPGFEIRTREDTFVTLASQQAQNLRHGQKGITSPKPDS